MTVLNIENAPNLTKEHIGSIINKEGFSIQINYDNNFEVFGTKGDILLVKKDISTEEIKEADEEIEIKTFDEFIEWWPSIKKGLGMIP